jgi:thiamine-monophosphate kinase
MSNYLKKFKKKKINFISKGDDYQIIFTSPKSKRDYIQKFCKKMNQKVTLIGNLTKDAKNNEIVDGDRRLKHANNEGYHHNF